MRDFLEFGYLSGNLELTAAPARFLKEIIRVGDFRHPAQAGETLRITDGRLREWIRNFYACPAKVWIPYRHSADPQDNTGWVEDLFADEGKLFAVMRITDERAAALLREGTVEDVSVGVERDFVDMDGRRYGEVVRHVALTLDPYIRNQTGFVPLGPAPEEQAKGGAELPESKYAYVDADTGEGYYPHHGDDGAVDLAAVRRALAEAAEEADLPDDVKDQIRLHLLAHLKEAGEAVAAEAAGREALELEARLASLDRKNRDLRRELRRLAEERRCREAEAVAAEVAAFLEQGKVLPSAAKKVEAILAAGSRHELEFEGEKTSVARLVAEVLEEMPAVVDFGQRLALEPPRERVPLSPGERRLLATLGITEDDFRRYGGK